MINNKIVIGVKTIDMLIFEKVVFKGFTTVELHNLNILAYIKN